VIAITALVMIVEVVAGIAFGSLALLADGLHMGSHTAALGLTVLAYVYARKFSSDRRFSFGTGKVNALAGFSSAILLAGFALSMVWESLHRLSNPVEIIYNQAIAVSVFGLMVNAVSAFFLAQRHSETGQLRDETPHQSHDHSHGHDQADHNLRSAYLHVLADALTSVLAIFALSAGKWFGLWWMDPLMGIVGAILITRWSWGLLRDTSAVLLDRQAPLELERSVRAAIEGEDGNRIADLHLWSIGPEIYAAAMSIVTDRPKSPPHYKSLLPATVKLAHVTIEVHPCNQGPVSLGPWPTATAGMPSPSSG
jgi:cation diffusion facilitator family transporter